MTMTPINYQLSLEPDLEKFSFNGFLKLSLESEDKTESAYLNILELDIHTCQVETGNQLHDCAFNVDTEAESLEIELPEPVSGKFCLLIKYTGSINNKMAGFYRSQYVSKDKTYVLAVTQFQESDARRAFPCLDHPSKKAVFDIEMVIDADLRALSNQDVVEEVVLENGKKKVVFRQSPKMSTYLVFWCVGAFSLTRDQEDSRVRIAVLPGMEPYIDFGLDFGKKALAYCEEYYGIAYPLSKLDLIAVPDFAFGAMENWGAITFRENLLLFYPELTSKTGAERIAEVISHEMAHQWFGNLVTPSDWKFLWLNESFATYFGFGVVDFYHPAWDTWSQFLYSQTYPALVRDAYQNTIPIEIPGGEHVVINTSTAPIIYCKGGSILRQIKGYIGESGFQKGVRHYLEKYRYDCATSSNLWESFEAVSDKPVTKMMKTWIGQPGYPLVEVQRNDNRLLLSQKRFSFQSTDSDQLWQIPVSINVCNENGQWRQIDLLMEDSIATADLKPDDVVFKLNSRQTGFYRVKYSNFEDLNQLGPMIWEQQLPPEDRWGLENDLFALVISDDVPLSIYLDFLTYYDAETDFLPLHSIADNLLHAHLLSGPKNQEQISQIGKGFIERVLSDIGFDPQPDEPHTFGTLRDQYIWQGVFFGSKTVSEFALSEFKKMTIGGSVHPDIMKSILMSGAFSGDNDTFEWFVKRLETSVSEHDRSNILAALGCFRDREILAKVCLFTLDKVPLRNQSIPVAALAVNPVARDGLWAWYTSEKDRFSQFHPMIHERVFASIVPACNRLSPEEVRHFMDTNHQQMNADVVTLTLERLAVNQRLRERLST